MQTRDAARMALGVIRSANGLIALFVPGVLIRRLRGDPEANGIAMYVFRMFGIRTAILGAELFLLQGERREEALRIGAVIHASDATAALIAGARRELPRKVAAMTFVLSSINTALAIAARQRARRAKWV